MHFSTRIVSILALGMLGATGTASAAAKVEETILGPTNVGGLFAVSPSGGHVAYLGRKGDRLFMTIDGVAGPEFEEIYKSAGGGAFFPQKAGVWAGTLGGIGGNDAPVLFSLDGTHSAYAGTQGKDYVVIHDGKEIGRGPWELMGRRGLTMSPGGRHVYWTEAKMEQGRTVARMMMTGKPGPWTTGAVTAVFSPDDLHYTYLLARTVDSPKQVMIVDGKDAGYVGYPPVYSADSSVLYTIAYEGGGASVLANGKPVIKAGVQVSKIVVAPVGRRYAAIVRQMVQNKAIDFLYIDGKQVPGSEHAQDAWFSPDGKRYAAVCHDPFGGPYAMLVDGKRGPDHPGIDNQPPFWTADSSMIIYTAGTTTGRILVVEGEEIPLSNSLFGPPVMAAQGNRFAWGTIGPGRLNCTLTVDGKSVLPPKMYPVTGTPQFSPDGARYAYLFGPEGRNEITGIAIDGVTQTGIEPGYFVKWMTGQLNALFTFVFSRDGQHIAFMGRTAAMPRYAMYLDGKVVHPNVNSVLYPTFTPDSQHFYWLADGVPGKPEAETVVYVDGQPAVRAYGYFFREFQNTFEVDRNGVATFLAVDKDTAKRYRITPSADSNIATIIANAAIAEAQALAEAEAAKKAAAEAAAQKKADQTAAAAKAKADYDAAVAAKARARQEALDAKKKAAADAAAAKAAAKQKK